MLSEFFQSDHFLALSIALLVFLVALFLAVKRWIGFWITVVLLVFSLAAGILINNQSSLQNFFDSYSSSAEEHEKEDAFQKQMLQAVEDLKMEMSIEKENLKKVVLQVQEIVDSIDLQKQKVQQFIEETRERFKSEYSQQNPSDDSSSDANDQ